MKKNILAPSILSADFCNLERDIKEVERAGAEFLHIDVMDGTFVPSLSVGMCVQESIRKCTDMIFDTHLMVGEPIRFVDTFAAIGSDYITVHLEACSNVMDTLRAIKAKGVKAGLSIKPETDAPLLLPYMEQVDMILIMSVEPGFGGQKYIAESTEKIRTVRRMIEESGRDILLEVDGGIKADNVGIVLEAGANVIVAGSAIFNNPYENTKEFLKILEENERKES